MLRVTVICMVIACIDAQIFNLNFGICDRWKSQDNFRMDLFAGKWYEWGKTPNPDQENARCDIVSYTSHANHTMTVSNTNLVGSESLQTTNTGVITFAEGSTNGDLRIVYPSNWNDPYDYQILATDYRSFAIVSACRNSFLVFHKRNVWALTRTKFPFQSEINAINDALNNYNIDKSPEAFIQTDQFFCPAFW